MKHILIIDDDIHIGDMLEEVLTREGYRVFRAYSGTEALLAVKAFSPDLVLLDLMLPGLSGEELLPKLKGIPTIVVSAKVEVDHKVELLLGGAADYVTKPFDTKELLARIRVALRNASGAGEVLCHGAISLEVASRRVTVNGQTLHLTPTEYAILKLLMQNPTRVLSKSQLLEHISADTPDCTEGSLKIHISNLRKKLKQACGQDMIEAVWGIGFKLAE